MSIFLVFLAIFRIVLLYKARETHSIWLNGIVAAQFGQIFGNMAVIIAILPALRLFFTEEQRKGFTMDVEKMQKAKAAGAGASGDTTLFSTTWSPEDGEQLPTPGIEKNTRDVQIAAGVANPPSSTTGGPNVIRKLGSLGGLRHLIRRGSGLQMTTPSPNPDTPGDLSRAQSMQIAITPRPQTEVPPLQVKLHQVIPDIGGETSPVIRTK
ncbi:hypothetical protein H072_4913 [Dactylellina haptotyla CBS 200.50]|uniref:CFEM domain-containing protein n=1 Tax=Dactylellina haptotyla (strain CBS 200.50) TaxID=1284197 RepID=S8C0Q1_DACHA|nr:hypothetical protein H072_4913 [Dactylellina haptotyla CBS 200.50]